MKGGRLIGEQEGKFRPNTGGVTLMAMVSIGIAAAGTLLVAGKNDEEEEVKRSVQGTSAAKR